MIPRPVLLLAAAGVALYLLSTSKAAASSAITAGTADGTGSSTALNLSNAFAWPLDSSTDTPAPTASAGGLLSDFLDLITGKATSFKSSTSSAAPASAGPAAVDSGAPLVAAPTPAQVAVTHDQVAASPPPSVSTPASGDTSSGAMTSAPLTPVAAATAAWFGLSPAPAAAAAPAPAPAPYVQPWQQYGNDGVGSA